MEIIAQNNGGFLISATAGEVQEILSSATGKRPEQKEIQIGQKLPALDYASSIERLKGLADDSRYTYLKAEVEKFSQAFSKLSAKIEQARGL